MAVNLPEKSQGHAGWIGRDGGAVLDDTDFDGVVFRRTIAFLFDGLVLVALFVLLWVFNLFTFLLLSGVIAFFWPALLFVIYDTVLLGGRGGATIGMRLLGVKMISWQGGTPGYLQALVLSVLFYMSVTFTSGLVLLVPLFSDRGRCLHDIIVGVYLVRVDGQDTG